MTKKVFGIPVVGILALVAVLAGLVVFLVWGMGNDVVTTVTLDVNPGIEMGLNIYIKSKRQGFYTLPFLNLGELYDNKCWRISCNLC